MVNRRGGASLSELSERRFVGEGGYLWGRKWDFFLLFLGLMDSKGAGFHAFPAGECCTHNGKCPECDIALLPELCMHQQF